MKIGAGGLQSLLHYDNIIIKKGETIATRANTAQEGVAFKPNVGLEDLVRLVEQLNRLAAFYNYPYRYTVRRERDRKGDKDKEGKQKGELVVEVEDLRTGEKRPLIQDDINRIERHLLSGDHSGLTLEREV